MRLRGGGWRLGVMTAVFVGAVATPATPAMPATAAMPAMPAMPATPTTPATGHGMSAPSVHTLSPVPGEVTAAGETSLRASVSSDDPVRSVRLTVDGRPVEPRPPGAPDSRGDVAVGGSVVVAPGEHVVVLAVEDAAGARSERAWSFTATDRSTARLAGPGRLETAAAISAAVFPAGRSAAAAVVARGDDFADALAGVPLAAAVGGPLLLADGDALPDVTAEELRRVLPPGAMVHLLGGEAALGNGVTRDVEALGLRAVRHAGRDRFGTAAAVAGLLPPSAGAIVASGASFPDALAASAPAARDGVPILLTAADHVPESTTAALAGRRVSRVTIVGGPAVVGERVEQRLGRLVPAVERVAGPDRYATAVAVLDAFYERPGDLSLAGGAAFPDALPGTLQAASLAQPLLLTDPGVLSAATAQSIRAHRPGRVTVYGGDAAVADHVVSAALRAAVDGPDAPRVLASAPSASATVTELETAAVTFDRPVDPQRSSVYVDVGGLELPALVEETGPTVTLTVRTLQGEPSWGDPSRPLGRAYPARLVVSAAGVGGGVAHDEVGFTYSMADPVFATAAEVALHLPSRDVEMVGFHESSHDGARQMTARDTATVTITLPSRGRGTGSRTAADVVAAPDQPVLAPVTGRVVRAGPYELYCRYPDDSVVIEPDARPGWEVKVLHFQGLRVRAGDRVIASRTVLGDGPRVFPFRSQVDDFSARGWPHVHVEVVDPSIPDRSGPGC